MIDIHKLRVFCAGVAEEIARGQLQELTFGGDGLYAGVYVACKRERALPRSVKKFRSFLIAELTGTDRNGQNARTKIRSRASA